MNKILLIVLTSLLVALCQWFLPWYSLVIPTFIIGFLSKNRKGFQMFVVGFFAVFLLWMLYISILSINNQFILANRLSVLFFKHQWNFLLIFTSSFIGGLVGGSATITGHYLRDAL
jgi:uncharacterized membrane protein (Fun14 family)